VILAIENLRLGYRTQRGTVRAVADACLTIDEHEAIGLVGESGSGKSSLARAMLGLLPRPLATIDGGRIEIAGRAMTHAAESDWERLRGAPVAIVFQDPLSFLNPVMRVGRQIAESIARHRSGRRVEELLALVRLPVSCADAWPHELSGGMRQRVALAIALGCGPRLLIADEPTTALDVTTQAEILALLRELRERVGMALLLITHDLAVVAAMCARVYVMYAGYVVEWGPTAQVFGRPLHPYTAALLQTARLERNARGRFATIEGDVPNLAEREGCPFAARCPSVMPRCRSEMPPPFAPAPGQTARCWLLA
jgi:oligopeptide/dipeptide ABC transporter ATP-binding protein